MLRLFLTVSVLFWNQLAAQDDVIEMLYEFCYQVGCPLPSEIVKYENYSMEKCNHIHWAETQIASMDEDALKTGLQKLINYSHFGNDAGTIVPVIPPWGIIRTFDNGNLLPEFTIYVLLAPEVNNPPQPTDPAVSVFLLKESWFFGRVVNHFLKVEQFSGLITEFMKDLERDNQNFEKSFVDIAFYSTNGLAEIAFLKINE